MSDEPRVLHRPNVRRFTCGCGAALKFFKSAHLIRCHVCGILHELQTAIAMKLETPYRPNCPHCPTDRRFMCEYCGAGPTLQGLDLSSGYVAR